MSLAGNTTYDENESFEEDLLDELVVEEMTIDCICGVY
ncbi:MAG: mycofactocin precursor [Firmicutes bacterium]|nr:mycofactocin precursor [Bacillota bacterium]